VCLATLMPAAAGRPSETCESTGMSRNVTLL
jgi:hypothetical protein